LLPLSPSPLLAFLRFTNVLIDGDSGRNCSSRRPRGQYRSPAQRAQPEGSPALHRQRVRLVGKKIQLRPRLISSQRLPSLSLYIRHKHFSALLSTSLSLSPRDGGDDEGAAAPSFALCDCERVQLRAVRARRTRTNKKANSLASSRSAERSFSAFHEAEAGAGGAGACEGAFRPAPRMTTAPLQFIISSGAEKAEREPLTSGLA